MCNTGVYSTNFVQFLCLDHRFTLYLLCLLPVPLLIYSCVEHVYYTYVFYTCNTPIFLHM